MNQAVSPAPPARFATGGRPPYPPARGGEDPVTELRIVVELRGATELNLSELFRSLGEATAGQVTGQAARVAEPERIVVADGLVVDLSARTVTLDGSPVHFTFMEFELLARLVAAPGRAFSRSQLRLDIWNTTYDGSDRTIDVHVGRIRRKVGRFGHRLEAVPRVGYRWSAPSRPVAARPARPVELPAQRLVAPVRLHASAL